jgi:hypothetical protein
VQQTRDKIAKHHEKRQDRKLERERIESEENWNSLVNSSEEKKQKCIACCQSCGCSLKLGNHLIKLTLL